MIPLSKIVIHISGKQLKRRVTGAFSHAVQRPVYHNFSAKIRYFHHLYAVCIGKLKIIVGMIPQPDGVTHMFVCKLKIMHQLVFMKQTVSIHQGKGIRLQVVHKTDQIH